MPQTRAKSVSQRLKSKVSVKSTKPVASEDDRLDIDPPIIGQKFVLISFLTEHQLSKSVLQQEAHECQIHGIKIRGIFEDEKSAKEYSDRLQKLTNAKFNIYIGEVGKWLSFDPNPNSIKDSTYQESRLNDLMKNYEKNIEYKNQVFELRKEYLKKNGLVDSGNVPPKDLPKEDFSFNSKETNTLPPLPISQKRDENGAVINNKDEGSSSSAPEPPK